MPVPLPVLSVPIPLPAAPADPPTLHDVNMAHRLVDRVLTNHQMYTTQTENTATADDLSCAQLYLHMLLNEMAGHGQGQGQGAAPADIGFIVQQAVQNAIQPLNARLDRIDQRLARIDQRLAGIDQRLPEIDQRLAGIDQRLGRIDRRVGELLDISYQSHNILSLDGITRPYKVIPFRQDGQEIWPEEHNLPRLTTAAAVHALHVPQVDAYLDGYHIPRAGRPRRSTKIKRLKAHIGCAYPA